MDVKEAVGKAREYVSEVYSEENIENIGLEEINFDETANCWKVTIGFLRPWDRKDTLPASLKYIQGGGSTGWRRRSFKIIQIDDRTGCVVSMTHRVVN